MVARRLTPMQYTLRAVLAASVLAGLPLAAAAEDLSNRAFQIQYGPSGITSLKRTGDVHDTDYIAANGALGRLIVRYRTAANGDWKELRDLLLKRSAASAGPAGPGSGEAAYTLGTYLPALASRASGSAVQGVAGIRGLNDGVVPRAPPAGGRGGGPGAAPAADVPVFTWTAARGPVQWVQYTFPNEETIGRTELFWTVAPRSWRLLYQEGLQWKEVAPAAPYGRGVNAFTTVEFAPVKTMALRIEVTLAPEAAPALAPSPEGP
jgi:hypothetical protein